MKNPIGIIIGLIIKGLTFGFIISIAIPVSRGLIKLYKIAWINIKGMFRDYEKVELKDNKEEKESVTQGA